VALLRDLAERKLIRQAISPEDLEPIITLTDGPLESLRSTSRATGSTGAARGFEIDQDLRHRGVVTAATLISPVLPCSADAGNISLQASGLTAESNNRDST
jgi:hypothetical protein